MIAINMDSDAVPSRHWLENIHTKRLGGASTWPNMLPHCLSGPVLTLPPWPEVASTATH
jgi:hypothetical protein